MELDTGSENNVVSVSFYEAHFRKADVGLRSYDGTSITAIGACDVKVRYGEVKKK